MTVYFFLVVYIRVGPGDTKAYLVNPLLFVGGLLDISFLFINILIGFKSIIPGSSRFLLSELALSAEEGGHEGNSTIIDI